MSVKYLVMAWKKVKVLPCPSLVQLYPKIFLLPATGIYSIKYCCVTFQSPIYRQKIVDRFFLLFKVPGNKYTA